MREGYALPDFDLRCEARLLDPDLSVRRVPGGRLDLSERRRRRISGTPIADLIAASHSNFACFARLSPASTTQARQLPTMQSRDPLLKKWTAEEHERLKALAKAGSRPDEIAGELGRSEAAVRVRAWQHGIALRLATQKRGP